MDRRFGLALSLLMIAALPGCGNADYQPPDPGLIQNPDFVDEQKADALGQPWLATQHSGDRSYVSTVSDGVLIIERIGPEPWGQVIQTVPAEPLRGKRAEFSVELAGDLKLANDPSGRWSNDTGLGVVVKGYRNRSLSMLGKAELVRAKMNPGMQPGAHDWRRYKLVFDVPENATDVQVEIRLTLSGVLRARGPRLVPVGGDDG